MYPLYLLKKFEGRNDTAFRVESEQRNKVMDLVTTGKVVRSNALCRKLKYLVLDALQLSCLYLLKSKPEPPYPSYSQELMGFENKFHPSIHLDYGSLIR